MYHKILLTTPSNHASKLLPLFHNTSFELHAWEWDWSTFETKSLMPQMELGSFQLAVWTKKNVLLSTITHKH